VVTLPRLLLPAVAVIFFLLTILTSSVKPPAVNMRDSACKAIAGAHRSTDGACREGCELGLHRWMHHALAENKDRHRRGARETARPER
jgi:hypothetical protein